MKPTTDSPTPSDGGSEIPNRFDFQQASEAIYQEWDAAGCFHAEVRGDRKPFTIVIPPPNVTGALHLGHALNNSLQDIQIRWHRMRGFEALWMPGTDHAGIATQAVVEKRLKELEGKTRHDLGREALVERIWQWKDQYETRILNQLKRMGASCDWRRTRFTLDETCARAVRATFYDLFSKGRIYRGKRLVNWDTYLQTAVSDDEVFHEVVKGHFYYMRYPLVDAPSDGPQFVSIATTRPETMLGDTAVAVHPDPARALDQAEAALLERIETVPAKDRPPLQTQLDELRERRATMLPDLIKLRDLALAGAKVCVPLVERLVPLVADTWAKPEMGTGCVKITPAHDPNDYEVAQRAGLELLNILNTDGKLNEAAGKYQGLTIQAARQRVVADMEALGLMDRIEAREIDLAHSDRSKTPIEPFLADQWFVRMEQLAQSAMDAVTDGQVQIIPERYAKGYLDWLSEKRDWPVGRQLWWGHQIPIWTRQFDTDAERESVANRLKATTDAQNGRLAVDFEEPGLLHVCLRAENAVVEKRLVGDGFQRQEDVLDTWFSSALWPHSTLGWPERTPRLEYFYPTSVLITSRDIITLWVARMVLMGLNNLGQVPFKQVFIHPKILDAFGETMSKSKGNGVDPIDVIDKFGADALRFGLTWLTTDTQDVRMPVQYECPHCQALVPQTKQNRTLPKLACDKCKQVFSTQWAESAEDKAYPKAAVVSERFEEARNFCNKLWNAARFVMINLEGYQGANQAGKIDRSQLPLEDRWILSRLATTTQVVDEALSTFRFADAARQLYDFAWNEFCSYYVEMAKPRLANPDSRRSTQVILAHVLDHLLRLLHPMIPFITEAIWQELARFGKHRSLADTSEAVKWIIRAPWPTARSSDRDQQIEQQFARFAAVLGALREIRSRQNLPPKAELSFQLQCDAATIELLKPMEGFFKALAGASVATWATDAVKPDMAAQLSADGMEVIVDLGKFIDVGAEIARNEKLLENLVKQIAGKHSKLNNASFVERAPVEVVDKERASLAELEQQRENVALALGKLKQVKP
ncbi:MAG: valine--tRNA ligase [Pirellulaceae bacterium]|nr:valine--tRNA ligase [Pirellulaceae bacterium]